MVDNRLIIGISGASGAIYGIRLLEVLKDTPIETHLVLTKSAHITIAQETGKRIEDIQGLADISYNINDIAATIASGSYKTIGMIVAPCSIKTMSSIATGITDNLISRAADVVLKEQRKLVLMVRESPLHAGHLETMHKLALMGAVIAPPVPAFYSHPTSIDDLVNHSIGRVLDLFGIESGLVKRWQGVNTK